MAKARERLSGAKYVKYGYGQVEDNKLSAKYNGKIFAMLPCKAGLDTVENGMFLCYDYAHKLVTLPEDAEGLEPLLVFNEVKVYEGRETDADFAMTADRYEARIYNATGDGVSSHVLPMPGAAADRTLTEYDNQTEMKNGEDNLNPYGIMRTASGDPEALKSNSIVPRLFKTDLYDTYTTNCVDETTLAVGDVLKVDPATGYLKKDGTDTHMEWTVIKVYNTPDLQPGVKIMRTK